MSTIEDKYEINGPESIGEWAPSRVEIVIVIETATAAFGDQEAGEYLPCLDECARILTDLASRMRIDECPVTLRDHNGNTVGFVRWRDDPAGDSTRSPYGSRVPESELPVDPA